jgi:hypothetical protein
LVEGLNSRVQRVSGANSGGRRLFAVANALGRRYRSLCSLPVKNKALVAFVLVLLGTNLLSYTTTRYLTTERVLITARQRLDDGLRREGLFDVVFPPDDERITRIVPTIYNAIRNAGGLYYWWNDALPYWAVGAVVAISGLLVPLLRPHKQNEG